MWVVNFLSTAGIEWDALLKSIRKWDAKSFHDRMLLEAAADKHADRVLDNVRGRSSVRWTNEFEVRYSFGLVESNQPNEALISLRTRRGTYFNAYDSNGPV